MSHHHHHNNNNNAAPRRPVTPVGTRTVLKLRHAVLQRAQIAALLQQLLAVLLQHHAVLRGDALQLLHAFLQAGDAGARALVAGGPRRGRLASCGPVGRRRKR